MLLPVAALQRPHDRGCSLTVEKTTQLTIVMADDDEDDRMLAQDAFEQSVPAVDLRFVEDGEELLQYLRRDGKFSSASEYPFPRLVLLDLNMPKMDGREALAEIKNDPSLRSVPVVILTTSRAEEDIARTYALGVSSFIVKPVSFDALVGVVEMIGKYWLEVVEPPPRQPHE